MDALKILLLEDSPHDVALLRRFLERDGWQADLAVVNTEQEWRQALAQPWDILLSDHSLPGFSARDALQIAQAATPETPFVLISGQIGEERAVDMLKAGAQDFISKENLERLGPVLRRLQAERSLRSQHQHLEQQFKDFFDRNLAGLAMFGLDGSLINANQALRKLLGLHGNDQVNVWSLFEAPELVEKIRLDLRHRQVSGPKIVQFKGRQGLTLHLLATFFLPQDTAQAPPVVWANFLDYTKLHLMEERLNHASKMESLGVFAGGIAHDFNNLLAIISGQASLLQLDYPELSKLQDRVEDIQTAARRGADLVRQLLLFASKKPAEHKPLNLVQVLRDTVHMVKQILPEAIQVAEAYEGKEVVYWGDANQLGQVFLNILVNARDALEHGGHIWIASRLEEVQDPALAAGFFRRLLTVTIRDDGAGIPKDLLPKIFDPFFTTKEVGKGTGLGLAVVAGILEAHMAQISCDSAPGQGTVFTLHFPLDQEDSLAEAAPAETKVTVSAIKPSARVLFVENEASLERIGKLLLETWGLEVLTAPNANLALELIRAQSRPFDLVISDYGMPGMDGLEFSRQVRQLHPHLPILIMSGYLHKDLNDKLTGAGVNAILQKPFDWNVLHRQIDALLQAADHA